MSLLGILGVAGTVGSLFKKFIGGNIGSALIGDWANKRSMERQFNNQMALQDDAQAFNAEQAELNRNFNAREAELAREWQEQFYNKYQSPSAMMAQYKAAGINPMLVAGQGTGSPPSTSSASGSPASSGIGSAAAGNLVGDIVQLMTLKKQMQQMDAQTNLLNSQAAETDSRVGVNESIAALNGAKLYEVKENINYLAEKSKTEQQKRELMVAQKALDVAKKEQISFSNALSNEFKKEFGYSAPVETINSLISIVGNALGNVATNLTNPFAIIKAFKGKTGKVPKKGN